MPHHVCPAEPEDGFGPGVPAGYNTPVGHGKDTVGRGLHYCGQLRLCRLSGFSLAYVAHGRHDQLALFGADGCKAYVYRELTAVLSAWRKGQSRHPSALHAGPRNTQRAVSGGSGGTARGRGFSMDLPSSSLAAYPKKASVRSLSATILPFPSTATAASGMRDRKVASMSCPWAAGQVLPLFRQPGSLALCRQGTGACSARWKGPAATELGPLCPDRCPPRCPSMSL